jgi:hypothetical protein
MSKTKVVKWYGAMLARLMFTMILVAFYSAEFFNSVV